MDINDILAAPTGVQRPDHPDYWKLSEIILGLKADKESQERGEITEAEFERRWRKNYESVGDFDSIAYCAMQCAFELFGIRTGKDFMMLDLAGKRGDYVRAVQAYFDGFIMGALLERKNTELGQDYLTKGPGAPISDAEAEYFKRKDEEEGDD